MHATESDTPFLNEWIKDTFRFEHVYSPADTTIKSMPATFRSVHAFEVSEDVGVPLANYMRKLGRIPIAVVNRLFTSTKRTSLLRLRRGFKHFRTYKHSAMHHQVGKMLNLVGKVKREPFFAWFHFYCLHVPGFAGTRPLTGEKGDYRLVYRKALEWVAKANTSFCDRCRIKSRFNLEVTER